MLKNREYTLELIQCTVPCTKDNKLQRLMETYVEIIKHMVGFFTLEKKSMFLVVISFPQLFFLQKKHNAMRLKVKGQRVPSVTCNKSGAVKRVVK